MKADPGLWQWPVAGLKFAVLSFYWVFDGTLTSWGSISLYGGLHGALRENYCNMNVFFPQNKKGDSKYQKEIYN